MAVHELRGEMGEPMMRKVVLYAAASLDGYIARSDGGLDWLVPDGDYGYNDFFVGIDTLVMGRKTYDAVKSFGDWPYGERTCYVLTHTPDRYRDDPVIFVSGPVRPMIDNLVRQPGGDIWLVGGGELVREFLRHDLVDEIILTVFPILLGDGIPLFPADFPAYELTLTVAKTYDSGAVQVTYGRKS